MRSQITSPNIGLACPGTQINALRCGEPERHSSPDIGLSERALSAAKTVGEVMSISDKAIGLVGYARKASDRELQAEATAIRMEAERRLGQIQQQKETVGLNKGGRPGFEKPRFPCWKELSKAI